jgi:hypothetical protein
MSNVTKFALAAAIILTTAFSVVTAATAGAAREQAASSGTGMAAYVESLALMTSGVKR